MNKFFLPLASFFFPYLALAQTNLNDNFGRCGYGGGSCPYFNDDRTGFWGGMMGGNMMGWGGMPFFGGLGGIIMVVFWILVIFAIVYLVKYLVWGGDYGRRVWTEEKMKMKMMKKEDSAVAILKERYAKGEIDKKELLEKMKDLRNL